VGKPDTKLGMKVLFTSKITLLNVGGSQVHACHFHPTTNTYSLDWVPIETWQVTSDMPYEHVAGL